MIIDLIQNKTAQERAEIKSAEISKLGLRGVFDNVKYGVKVEIVSDIQHIEIKGNHGIELLARAWKKGKQLGFGEDGSVEIERFRIFNPPILTDDPNGDIIREWTDAKGNIQQRKLREDPAEAIKNSLAHIVKAVGKENTKIIKGKIGSTTSTFYSGAGDGHNRVINANWTTAREAASATDNYPAETSGFCQATISSGNYYCGRVFLPIDTSAIPDTDVISSANLEIVGVHELSSGAAIGLIQTTQADPTALVADDYDNIILNSPPEGATRKADSDLPTVWGTLITWALNATGLGWISKTGWTLLGIRVSLDIDNTTPTAGNTFYLRFSEYAGTDKDPRLVVTHSSPVAGRVQGHIF